MAVGFMAGLIPCPLPLFVMTYAIARGVPAVGVAFAATMMLGVALTLSVVAAATVLFRQKVVHLIDRRADLLDKSTRALEAVAGLALMFIAVRELMFR